MASSALGRLVIDVRGLDPDHRRAMIFSIIDKFLELGCSGDVVLVSNHDPSALGYQIDLRRESRGFFEFTCDLRSDGAWVALLQRKSN